MREIGRVYKNLICCPVFRKCKHKFAGDYLHEKYDEATQVKINKRGRLQVKDPRYKVPTALDLVYLDESPDWCRINKQLQWPGNFYCSFSILLQLLVGISFNRHSQSRLQ